MASSFVPLAEPLFTFPSWTPFPTKLSVVCCKTSPLPWPRWDSCPCRTSIRCDVLSHDAKPRSRPTLVCNRTDIVGEGSVPVVPLPVFVRAMLTLKRVVPGILQHQLLLGASKSETLGLESGQDESEGCACNPNMPLIVNTVHCAS